MDNNFETTLKFILQREGGYVNDPHDLGGETNKGITHSTYNSYRRSKGLAPRSVKYITDDEVRDIYYNNYYKASGADKISNPKLAAYVFDTAVNMGVGRAKTFLNQCNDSPEKFEQLRRAKYNEFVKAKPDQKRYLQGWNNRVTQLGKYADTNFPNTGSSESTGSVLVLKGGIEENVYLPELDNSNFGESSEILLQQNYEPDSSNDQSRVFKLEDEDTIQPIKKPNDNYNEDSKNDGVVTGQAVPISSATSANPQTISNSGTKSNKSPSQNFSDLIRQKFNSKINENNKKLKFRFNKSSGSQTSGNGRWVTMRGRHVFIED